MKNLKHLTGDNNIKISEKTKLAKFLLKKKS